MNIGIESLAWAKQEKRKSLLDLIVHTGKECLKKSRYAPEEIQLLLNSGIYNEGHYMEPSFGAFIQDALQINAGLHDQRTLSFDLLNGNNGVLQSLFVLQSLLITRTIRVALLFTFDLNKDRQENLAVAMILEQSREESTGFQTICFKDYLQYQDYDCTTLNLVHNQLIGYKSEKLEQIRLECIEDSIFSFLDTNKINSTDLHSIIIPRIPGKARKKLAEKLQFNPAHILSCDFPGRGYSQSTLEWIVLSELLQKQIVTSQDRVGIFCFGSGITMGCTVYQI